MAGFGGRRRVDGDKAEEVKVEERKGTGGRQEAVIAVGVCCALVGRWACGVLPGGAGWPRPSSLFFWLLGAAWV